VKKIVGIFLILTLILSIGCRSKQEKAAKKNREKPVPVVVTTVHPKDFWITLSSIGTVKPWRIVYIKSKIPGKVIRIHVKVGASVRKGMILAELDPTDYSLAVANARDALKAAQLAYQEACVTLQDVTKDWERYRHLYEKKVISKQKWDHMQTARRKALIMRDLTRARVSRARVALQIARTNLNHTRLRAPFNGVVTRRLVDPGARVYTMPPTVLMVLMDLSRVKVMSDIPERQMPWIHPGSAVTLSFDALPGKIYHGKITRIHPQVDPVTRNFRVEVDLANPGQKIESGMFAHVRVRVRHVRGLLVPRSALLKIPGTATFYAFRVTGNTVEKVNLETGRIMDHVVEVRKGLKAGDRIVTVGNTLLRTGRKITIVKQENPA